MAEMELQAQIERFGRLYVASSQVSRLVMRCKSREELLQEAVRILVDVGKFALSFISWLDPITQQFVPVSRFGDANEYADRAPMFADERLEGQGPAGTAFRQGAPYVCNDFLNDPITAPWRDAASSAGWRASVAFPILAGGSPRGLLSVYGREVGMFGPDQVELLQQVTLDVAFGLDRLAEREERRRAEESLRQKEDWHRTIVQTAMDGFWLVDIQGHLLEVNDTYCRMSGYCAEELLTMRVSDLVANQTPDETAARIQRFIEQGEARFESRHRRKDGSTFEVEVSLQYRTIEGGRLVIFLRDITERKRAEDALRASEAKFRDLFDSAPVAYHELDQDAVIRRVNGAECALLGYADGEMVGRPVWEFVREEERAASRAMLRRKLSGEPLAGPVQRRFVRSDGGELWLEIHDMPVWNETGEIIGIRTALIDIADRKKAGEALLASEGRLQLCISASNIGLWDWDLARTGSTSPASGKVKSGTRKERLTTTLRNGKIVCIPTTSQRRWTKSAPPSITRTGVTSSSFDFATRTAPTGGLVRRPPWCGMQRANPYVCWAAILTSPGASKPRRNCARANGS
jgi:PAS domain S-box-containing protein